MNTHGSKRRVYCQRDVFEDGVKFWLKETTWTPDRQTVAVAQPLTFRTLTPADEGYEQQPAFALHNEQVQQFMDELWRVGFRPTEGTGSAGALAATERHLQDMRTLVFKQEAKT